MGKVIDFASKREIVPDAMGAAWDRVRLSSAALDLASALSADAHNKIGIAFRADEITVEDMIGLASIFDFKIVRDR